MFGISLIKSGVLVVWVFWLVSWLGLFVCFLIALRNREEANVALVCKNTV